jgi:hypothetical protein
LAVYWSKGWTLAHGITLFLEAYSSLGRTAWRTHLLQDQGPFLESLLLLYGHYEREIAALAEPQQPPEEFSAKTSSS